MFCNERPCCVVIELVATLKPHILRPQQNFVVSSFKDVAREFFAMPMFCKAAMLLM